NKIKYLNYLTRVLQRYLGQPNLKLRMIVIYTADVKRRQVKESLDVGDLKITLEQAFLSELESETILANITNKVTNGNELTEDEKMQFIILPLSYEGKENKRWAIRKLFELSKLIKNEETQIFLIAGMIAFADKVLDSETAREMKGWIGMTKVARLFEEEKQQAVKKAVEEAVEERDLELAQKMLEDGVPEEKILEYMPKAAVQVLREKGRYAREEQ
ncbi:MAG: hypothetical protein PHN80_15670, partial [Hespellia sp.]|nr:hypothetical protein [Hespellia sp.]